jgi:hypothetical protein
VAQFPAESFPHLGETLRVFLASEFDYAAEFDFGLDLILHGLERLRV